MRILLLLLLCACLAYVVERVLSHGLLSDWYLLEQRLLPSHIQQMLI